MNLKGQSRGLEKGNKPRWDITYLGTKAVANGADLLHAESLAHVLDGRGHDRIHTLGLVVGEPRREVDLASVHGLGADLVAMEQVGEDGQVAIVGELINQELVVDEDAEDIGEEDNSLLGLLVILRVGDVGLDCRRERNPLARRT